jgi:TonB family protein
MNEDSDWRRVFGLRHLTVRLLQAAALALVMALALFAKAAEDRAVLSRVAPAYPEIAKRLRITGVVRVEATVEPDGKVSEVKSISGNHMLSPAAEEAVRRWRFAPAAGVSSVLVDVNFAAGN